MHAAAFTTESYASVRCCNVRFLAQVLKLMLGTAQLEFTLKEMFKTLLKCKRERWEKAQAVGVQKMHTISDFFGGEQVCEATDA